MSVINLNNKKHIKAATREMDQTIMNLDQNIFFEVEERPIYVENKLVDSHKAIYRPDMNETLSIVGKDYKIVTNKEIFGSFDESLAVSGLDLKDMSKSVELSNNGQKTYCRYRLPGHSVNIGTDSDKTVLEFCAINSYDGSTSFTAFVGGYRLLCANGQVWGDNLSYFRKRHTTNLDVNPVADKLRIAAEKFVEMGEEWSKWANVDIDEDEALEILMAGGFAERTAKKIVEQFDKEAQYLDYTKWALYNAVTHHATHEKVSKTKEKNAPAIVARRESEVRKLLNTKKWLAAA